MNAIPRSPAPNPTGTNSSCLKDGPGTAGCPSSVLMVPVRDGLQRATPEQMRLMPIAMLNRYIGACARLMFEAQRRYEQTGCFADAGDRDAWLHAECDALVERGQRPDVVEAMERVRGLTA